MDSLGLAKANYRYKHGPNGELRSATAKITQADIGKGTCTNCSSRAKARALGEGCDDAGHAIGKQLGGDGGVNGTFPQNPNINRGVFRDFENDTARRVQAGDNVILRVTPVYNAGSTRPHEVIYQRRVNGVTERHVFNNPGCP
ncbi:DNA/RNA non-specific endonuclease [Iodobacter violaceini]|uniref:DNA/RNA non-specific endonuclease n=1 Tax=Iodobacter violaceini TaxID=3044271 RepID=UPI0027E426DD|nr:DNA/RNA non-specific endonuclease [Iodobacter violacea]